MSPKGFMDAKKEFLEANLGDGEYVIETNSLRRSGIPGEMIILTNQRLIVAEADEVKRTRSGFITELSWRLKHAVPLESIREVSAYGWGNLTISTSESTTIQLWSFLVEASIPKDKRPEEYFRERILQQIKDRRQELERRKVPMIIDFSFLKTLVEKGGIVLTTLKCPHCGASIKMPEKGAETVCEHCSSNIYAVDILEKVKKLME